MAEAITLRELLGDAVKPQSVNGQALFVLLSKMISAMGIELDKIEKDELEAVVFPTSGSYKHSEDGTVIYKRVKLLENRLSQLESLPTVAEVIADSLSSPNAEQRLSVEGLLCAIDTKDTVQANRRKIDEVGTSIDTLLRRTNEALFDVDQMRIKSIENSSALSETIDALKLCQEKIVELEKEKGNSLRMDIMEEKMKQLDSLNDQLKTSIMQCITWQELENALQSTNDDSITTLQSIESHKKAWDALKSLAKLPESHKALEAELELLKDQLSSKIEVTDIENLASKDEITHLNKSIDKLEADLINVKKVQLELTTDPDLKDVVESHSMLINQLSNASKEATGKFESLQQSIQGLSDDVNELNISKADCKTLDDKLLRKADVSSLDTLASQWQLDSCISDVQQSMENLQADIANQEQTFSNQLAENQDAIKIKIDKSELEHLKKFLNGKVNALKNRLQENVVAQEAELPDAAAGLKRVLTPFDCLSCGRSLNLSQESRNDCAPRPCGGQHTSIMWQLKSSAHVRHSSTETLLHGQDGRLYRGRTEHSNTSQYLQRPQSSPFEVRRPQQPKEASHLVRSRPSSALS